MIRFYAYIGALILLMSVGRVVWRRTPPKIDWELIVAFVRLEFPPGQRDVAQKIAAGLAEIARSKITQLKPDTTLRQIASWAEERVDIRDLVNIFKIAYNVDCEADTTFRALVERIAETQQRVKGER